MTKVKYFFTVLFLCTFVSQAQTQTLDDVVENGNSSSKEIELSHSNGLILKQNTRTSGFNSLRIGQYGASTQFMRFVPYSTFTETWDWNHDFYYDFDNTKWAVDGDFEVDEAFTVKSGKVGIGITSPQRLLHVGTNIPSDVDVAQFSNGDPGANKVSIRLSNSGTDSWISSDRTGQNAGADLVFETDNKQGARTEAMRITEAGNVGIGTTEADKMLTVNGDIRANQIVLENDNTIYKEGFGFGINSDRGYLFRQHFTAEQGDFIEINNQDATGGGDRIDYLLRISGKNGFQFMPREVEAMRITRGGNVGIGVTNPQRLLHVGTNIPSDVDVAQFSNGDPGANKVSIRLSNSGTDSWISSDRTGQNAGADLVFETDNKQGARTEAMRITEAGNVGIGTTNPDSELAVNGTIHTKEVKVNLNGWSDFVFEEDYPLRTLEEVEQHIDENGHLPEIPSEDEVTEHGINLGEMDAKLLQKIEELTLYLIEQDKRNKAQQTRIEVLEKRLAELENSKE